jgi:hypothetical protein
MAANKTNTIMHVPKNDIETQHKVIRFGTIFEGRSEEEENKYKFLHQRADLKVSKGVIPVGFMSTIQLLEDQPIYLETRNGGYDERNRPVGPEYQVSWRAEKEVIGTAPGQTWSSNFDDLWTAVLANFERKNLLSEDTLEYLDADPFVLFGIDDLITQQALRKLEKFPALMCEGSTPQFEEWARYLRVEPDPHSPESWLVRAFLETDLPKPWTCYKGVGSIVCYIRSDSGQVTWKHPFYDYFRQLRDFCRQASSEEVMQVRCNRLLWSYEASRVQTEHDQEPLVSPEYVSAMADIFGYDIKTQGYLVRNIKAQLKIFARDYREKQDIELGDVVTCAEILARDEEKFYEMRELWEYHSSEEVQFDLKLLAKGELQCVNCGTTALSFCLECKDYLCLACYEALHSKGARAQHAPFRLVPCSLCTTMPAKLHCNFTDKSLCHECYAMKHIKMLPADGKENKPQRIDYLQQYKRYAQFAQERSAAAKGNSLDFTQIEDSYESVLSTDWHPFHDVRGVKYYHNFSTGERMRQSPRRVPNGNDPGALPAAETALELEEASTMGGTLSQFGSPVGRGPRQGLQMFLNSSTNGLGATAPMALAGYESLRTEPLARVAAATQPELRALRPPHRVHMPSEVLEY